MRDQQSLLWTSLDTGGLITAVLGRMLCDLLEPEESHVRWLRATTNDHLLKLASAHTLGLSLWCVDDESQLPGVCESLVAFRQCSPTTTCIVFVGGTHATLLSVLVEAGAQLVVQDVSSLQRGLANAVRVAPRSRGDFHPLTAGLFERLPKPHFIG